MQKPIPRSVQRPSRIHAAPIVPQIANEIKDAVADAVAETGTGRTNSILKKCVNALRKNFFLLAKPLSQLLKK